MGFSIRLIIIITVTSCFASTHLVAQVISIPSIKKMRLDSLAGRQNLAPENDTVEGYFFKDPLPLLLSDPRWAHINSPMPDSVFIKLDGEMLHDNIAKFQGELVRVTGFVNSAFAPLSATTKMGERTINYIPDFIVKKPIEILRQKRKFFDRQPFAKRAIEGDEPAPINMCSINPALCTVKETNNKNIALIYSGGIDASNAHTRYWNDINFMYHTLQSQYGYKNDQIIVVYKDGIGEDLKVPVNYAANEKGVNSAFQQLSKILNGENDLFIFMTNHGGGYNEKEKFLNGGVEDFDKDEIDQYKYDETTFYYGQPKNEVTDDFFKEHINQLKFKKLIGLFGQCYSGGFLFDLKGANRILLSAASEFEYSWSDNADEFDIFCYEFTAAINKSYYNSTPTYADSNGDGRISILEAFNYARQHDHSDDHPQLEDSGDGIGIPKPKTKPNPGADGYISGISFFDN